MREIDLFEGIEGLDPLLWIAIAQEGHPVHHGVAGHNHLFLGQINKLITIGMGAA